MNRREFLKGISLLPLAGVILKPGEVAAAAVSVPDQPKPVTVGEWRASYLVERVDVWGGDWGMALCWNGVTRDGRRTAEWYTDRIDRRDGPEAITRSREAGIAKIRRIIAEHPEWVATEAPVSEWGTVSVIEKAARG